MFVEAFVPQAAIEGLDECVLHWFAWCDVVPVESSERPTQHGSTGQFAAVIANNHPGYAAFNHQALQFAYDTHAADGGIRHASEAFAAEVVHDTEDPKSASIAQCVGDEIQRPALINRFG